MFFRRKTAILEILFSLFSPGHRGVLVLLFKLHISIKHLFPTSSATIFIPVAEEPGVERRIHIFDFLCKNLNKSFHVEAANPDLL